MKRYNNYGTVRFIRTGYTSSKVSVQSAAMPNWRACDVCGVFIPRREYPDHMASHHPITRIHFDPCPACGGPPYTVAAGELQNCEHVSACDYCGTIQSPRIYRGTK